MGARRGGLEIRVCARGWRVGGGELGLATAMPLARTRPRRPPPTPAWKRRGTGVLARSDAGEWEPGACFRAERDV